MLHRHPSMLGGVQDQMDHGAAHHLSEENAPEKMKHKRERGRLMKETTHTMEGEDKGLQGRSVTADRVKRDNDVFDKENRSILEAPEGGARI